jgi:DNA polymerase III subunit delta'
VSFRNFLGNQATTRQLRESIAAGRMPQSIILSGARGSGKYTLALMLAQTINCKLQPLTDGLPDFCGTCSNCIRIGSAQPLEERVAEAVSAREELRETDKKETRILIQPHPDLLVIPPDPPQLLIKLGQVRSLIRGIYRLPSDARRAVYIFTSSAFMKEAANSLLKVLEEPPEHATIILLAENVNELLPTIRSRAAIFRLGALPPDQIEALVSERRGDLKPQQRALIARLAEGAVGRALALDLTAYLGGRQDALILLRHATTEADHSTLFRMTETYRAGAEGAEKTTTLLRAFSSLLEDMLLIQAGVSAMVRNIDILPELERMAGAVSPGWIESASRGIDQVESGMRRNLLRSLTLDSFAAGLDRPQL